MIELLLPGWIAGMLLAMAVVPLGSLLFTECPILAIILRLPSYWGSLFWPAV